MKLLIALLVVATVMDLSCAVPRVSVQANADKLDQFLRRTFSPSISHGLSARPGVRGGEDMHDVILVLDSSGSIGDVEFGNAKKFMAAIVNILPSIINRDNTRIACISFSEANKIKTEFGFLAHTTKGSVIQAINPINYHHGGSTHTAKALQKAKKLFEEPGRTRARKTLFLATDGQSNGGGDPALPAIEMKKPDGLNVTIFVAAVSQNVNVQEVQAIASSPAHVRGARAARAARAHDVMYVDSFSQALHVTDVVRKKQQTRRLDGIHGWLSRGLAL